VIAPVNRFTVTIDGAMICAADCSLGGAYSALARTPLRGYTHRAGRQTRSSM